MDFESNIGPYHPLLVFFKNSEVGDSLNFDEFSKIFRKIDPLKNSGALIEFLTKFRDKLFLDVNILRDVLGVSLLNVEYGRPEFDEIVRHCCVRYENILAQSVVSSMDLDNILGMLRLFFDAKCPVDIVISCLLARVSLISSSDIENKVVISNNSDVFELIDKNDSAVCYAYCLSRLLDKIFIEE